MAIVRFLLMSGGMLVATMFMGWLPLAASLSPKKVSAFAALGSGLLLGAALSVVLPEGIGAVYDSGRGDQSHVIAYAVSLGFALMFVLDSAISWSEEQAVEDGAPTSSPDYFTDEGGTTPETPYRPSRDAERGSPAATTPTPLLKRHRTRQRVAVLDADKAKRTTLSLVVGLLIHSLADGISLGASSAFAASGESTLDIVVFGAILVHKAPAAFGLSSVLLQSKAPRAYIRRVIILFSCAAPVGGLATYTLLRLFASGDSHLQHLTGIALCLSAGTFLFVATHVLADSDETMQSQGETLGKRSRAVYVLCGFALPALSSLAIGGHDH